MSVPPKNLRRDTRVFISAVTRELGSVRKLVKKGLEDNDYHAVEQDNFPPSRSAPSWKVSASTSGGPAC